MAATMHDVARVAGVSVKTVSNVINDYPYVRPATRERVRSAIAELDYRPNLSARGLRSGKTGVIGLAIPELRQNYFAELADAVIRAAERRNVAVLVDQTGATREGEIAVAGRTPAAADRWAPVQSRAARSGRHRDAAGAVPAGAARRAHVRRPHRPRHDAQRGLGPRGHRAPARHRPPARRGDRRAPDPSGRHPLREPSRTRLPGGARRGRASRTTRRSCGSPPRGIAENGAAAMRDLLADGVEFDAVFTFNDTLGLGALRTLGQAGVRVPEDVAVIGLDNIDEARFSVPSMSSVDPGRDQIAEVAVDLLIERINEKGDPAPPRQILADFRVAAASPRDSWTRNPASRRP